MDGQIEVRSCTEADVGALLALWQHVAAPHSKPDTARDVLLRLQRDPELFLLALDGDVIVGSLIAGWDGWRGNLYRMAVAPDQRRRGIGTKLLEEAEHRLAAMGCTRIHAAVVFESGGALPFWSAMGYAPNKSIAEHAKDLLPVDTPVLPGNIRLAEPWEAERVASLVVRLITELGGVPPDPDGATVAARALIARPELGLVSVAVEAGVIVGICTVTFEHAIRTAGRHATIQEVFVLPERRNSGLGDQLVRYALDEAVAKGCAVVELSTPLDDAAQVRFYDRSGFRVVGRRLRYRA